MTINIKETGLNWVTRIKEFLADEAIFTAMLLILVALASFGLGRQSVSEKNVKSEENIAEAVVGPGPTTASVTTDTDGSTTYYVGSKNGQVYHLPYCSGAKRITETNKIIFKTKIEAEQAGYRPASNCKGI